MLNEQQITPHITIGGQPRAEDIEDLKARGFETIINLQTPDEPGVDQEERMVKDAGLSYLNVPVSPPILDDLAVSRFSQAIDSSDGPVAVHCKGGGRAGVMTLLYLGIENGWSVERTLQEGARWDAKIGKDSPYRAFFEDYLRRHSAGERTG